MTELSRRHVLAGAAAASAATALTPFATSPASAAAPLAAKQAPGWYRYNVGSYEITVVTDGRSIKLARHLRRERQEGSGERGAAAAHYGKGPMTIPYTPIVINTGSKLIVVDTGVGEANFEHSKGAERPVPEQPEGRRHRPRQGRPVVVISHFHGDHINGLIEPDSKPAFPNAEIMVPAVEWKYFMDDDESKRAGRTERMKEVFAGTRRCSAHSAQGHAISTSARNWRRASPRSATPGHTPGHVSHVASGARRCYVQSDVTQPWPVRCSPAIRAGTCLRFDQDPTWPWKPAASSTT